MPSTIELQIKERINSFVSELDLLVRKSTLEALRGVLETGTAPARRGRPAGSGRGPGRPRAAAGGNSADAILAFVTANDGQGVREIAAGVGISNAVAKKAVAQLLGTGALKKSGVRRGTKYHLGSGKAPVGATARKTKRGKRRSKKAKK